MSLPCHLTQAAGLPRSLCLHATASPPPSERDGSEVSQPEKQASRSRRTAQSGQYFGPSSLLFRIENLMLGTEGRKPMMLEPPSQSLQALKDLC